MAERSMTIRIAGDADKFTREMNKVKKQTKNLENILKSTAKVSGIAFAGLTATVGLAVNEFAKQERSTNKLKAALQATGNVTGFTVSEFEKMALALQDVTTFSDGAIIEAQSVLVTFTEIGRDVFPRAQAAALDLAAAMGTDAASASRTLGLALEDPIKGADRLRRSGIVLNDQQKQLIKTLQESGKTAEAQAVILDALESRIGGTAQATAQGAGSFAQLQNVIGNLAVEFGAQFMPLLEDVVGSLTELLRWVRDNNSDVIALAASFTKFAIVATGVVTALAVGAIGFLKLKAAIAATVAAVKLLTAGVGVLMGATGIGLIVVGVGLLVFYWDEAWEIIVATTMTAVKTLTGLFRGLGTMIRGIMKGDLDALKLGFAQSMDAVGSSFDTFQEEMAKRRERAAAAAEKQERDLAMQSQAARELTQEEILNKEIEAQLNKVEQMRALESQQRQEELERIAEHEGLKTELMTEFTEKERTSLRQAVETKSSIQRKANEERIKEQIKMHNMFLQNELEFGNAIATMDRIVHDNRVTEMRKASADMQQLTQSSNANLKRVGQAFAVSQITIDTATQSVSIAKSIISALPFPVNAIVATAAVAARAAFGAEQIRNVLAANQGGMVPRNIGIRGIDSVPTITTPGELIVPEKNFDEVVDATARNRIAQSDFQNEMDRRIDVQIAFDGDEASRIFSIKRRRESALGIFEGV